MPTTDAPGAAPLLNAKRERFVQEYLVDLNALQATIRAGYSPGSAHVTSSRLLDDARVQARIAHFQQEIQQKTSITIERVLQELAAVAFANVQGVQVDEVGRIESVPGAEVDAVRAVASVKRTTWTGRGEDAASSVTVEVRYWPKVQALELLGRHLGLFPTKVEVTGKDGAPLIPPGRIEPEAIPERLREFFATAGRN